MNWKATNLNNKKDFCLSHILIFFYVHHIWSFTRLQPNHKTFHKHSTLITLPKKLLTRASISFTRTLNHHHPSVGIFAELMAVSEGAILRNYKSCAARDPNLNHASGALSSFPWWIDTEERARPDLAPVNLYVDSGAVLWPELLMSSFDTNGI